MKTAQLKLDRRVTDKYIELEGIKFEHSTDDEISIQRAAERNARLLHITSMYKLLSAIKKSKISKKNECFAMFMDELMKKMRTVLGKKINLEDAIDFYKHSIEEEGKIAYNQAKDFLDHQSAINAIALIEKNKVNSIVDLLSNAKLIKNKSSTNLSIPIKTYTYNKKYLVDASKETDEFIDTFIKYLKFICTNRTFNPDIIQELNHAQTRHLLHEYKEVHDRLTLQDASATEEVMIANMAEELLKIMFGYLSPNKIDTTKVFGAASTHISKLALNEDFPELMAMAKNSLVYKNFNTIKQRPAQLNKEKLKEYSAEIKHIKSQALSNQGPIAMQTTLHRLAKNQNKHQQIADIMRKRKERQQKQNPQQISKKSKKKKHIKEQIDEDMEYEDMEDEDLDIYADEDDIQSISSNSSRNSIKSQKTSRSNQSGKSKRQIARR